MQALDKFDLQCGHAREISKLNDWKIDGSQKFRWKWKPGKITKLTAGANIEIPADL